MRALRIGIDFGRVIAGDTKPDGTKYPVEEYSLRPEVPGAIETIQNIVSMVAANNVFIIRNARSPDGTIIKRKKAIRETKKWFKKHQFFERTGMDPAAVFYPPLPMNKGEVMSRLKLTHMVDDRYAVAAHTPPETTIILFQPLLSEFEEYGVKIPPRVANNLFLVEDWSDVYTAVFYPEVLRRGERSETEQLAKAAP